MSVNDYLRAAHVVPMPYSIAGAGSSTACWRGCAYNRDERVAV